MTTAIRPRNVPVHPHSQIDAVQAIVTAYFALNAATSASGNDSALALEDGKGSPMGHVADAGRAALRRMEGITYAGGTRIWDEIIKNGESVAYNLNLYRAGVI